MLMRGGGGRGEMAGADGGGFYPQGGDGGAEGAGHHQSGGSTGVQQGGTAGGAPADGRFHAFPLTPMDEAGLRLRGLALRRGARADVEDSDVSARGGMRGEGWEGKSRYGGWTESYLLLIEEIVAEVWIPPLTCFSLTA